MSDVTPTQEPTHGPINDAGDGQVVSERQVKQGRRGVHMFGVLAISIVLAVLVMFGIWSLHFGRMDSAAHATGASKAAAAQTFDTGPSQPRAAPNTPSAP
jgi:hypothetical protein